MKCQTLYFEKKNNREIYTLKYLQLKLIHICIYTTHSSGKETYPEIYLSYLFTEICVVGTY